MTVQIAVGRSSGKSSSLRSGLQIIDSHPGWSSVITASATSQATTKVAPRGDVSLVWDIENGGAGAIWVTFGVDPTAAPGVTWLIPPGSGKAFGARPGDKCAVINA